MNFISNQFKENIIRLFVFVLFFNFTILSSFSQISISFPTNRAIFQRDNANNGVINIIGNYTEIIDRIEARLLPVVVGQGTETDWTLIKEKPTAGYFTGQIKGKGGWYKLEVRALRNNTIIKTLVVEKVGIGEVFIALGQSNAQGLPNSGAKGATEDRVNAINFFNDKGEVPENLNFVQLSENSDIAPHGTGPWCYGELGDKLVKKLNVPVLFFNAGFLLVSVINWRESAEGIRTYNSVLDIVGPFEYMFGLPYANLRNTLNYYGVLMGVRSLLWLQGETDNSPNRLSADVYAANLQRLIDISRQNFDENLTWVVARTSLTYMAPSNPQIIAGQNKVIEKVGNNVFAGPFTDNLQVPRLDAVHFKNIPPDNMGLSLLAENWNISLNDNFFQNSRPILPKSIVEPQILCNNSNEIVLKVADNAQQIEWSNGAKTAQTILVKDTISVRFRDDRGNKYISPVLNAQFIYPNEIPTISSKDNLEFCTDGIKSIELEATSPSFSDFEWNSGEKTSKISVSKSGEFSVKAKNSFGCLSQPSNKVIVKANPFPSAPIITLSSANHVCDGDTIKLTAQSDENVVWSNGIQAKSIWLNKIANYEISAKAISQFACETSSKPIKLSISPKPNQPLLNQFSPFSLEATAQDYVEGTDEFEWLKANKVLSKTKSNILKVDETNNYGVRLLRTYVVADNERVTCQSKMSPSFSFQVSDNILTIYPNPVSDILYIDTKELWKNVEIKLYNLIGQQVYKSVLDNTAKRQSIDLKNLPKGQYIIKLSTDLHEQSARIIIQ